VAAPGVVVVVVVVVLSTMLRVEVVRGCAMWISQLQTSCNVDRSGACAYRKRRENHHRRFGGGGLGLGVLWWGKSVPSVHMARVDELGVRVGVGAGVGVGVGVGVGAGWAVVRRAKEEAYPVVSYAPRPMLKSSAMVVLRIIETVCLASSKSATVGRREHTLYTNRAASIQQQVAGWNAAWHKGLTRLARERKEPGGGGFVVPGDRPQGAGRVRRG
jgi:hypothetical protein